MVPWLAALLAASCGMGLLMELNSYGEIYVFLMFRLPMAVFAAAFLVDAVRYVRARNPWLLPAPAAWLRPGWLRWTAVAVLALLVAGTFGVQTKLWWMRNLTGFRQWVATPANLKADDYMQQLAEALLWVRRNTEPNAVLVANACTPENMKKDHWGALDRTLTGVHFYYSALSERRLWFEGPNYIRDATRVRIRANLASAFFYRGRPLDPAVVSGAQCYILLDRSLADGAKVALPAKQRIFTNARMEVYRVPRGPQAVGVAVAVNEQ